MASGLLRGRSHAGEGWHCWWTLVFFAVSGCLVLVMATPDWSDYCPSSCRCKWISGKKTALCSDAGFTTVPNTLNSDIQVLDLTGNTIPFLTKDAFRSVGLNNLQKVFIRRAGLREVHRDAFRDLKILIEVDLSDNVLSSIHPDTFTGNDRLRILCLNGNPLTELRDSQFPSLPHLRTLEMQECQLRRIHRDAFIHLATLESLNLNGNKLKHVSEAVFLPIVKLKTLSLDNNPWRCDCKLRGFRNWLLASNLYSISLMCTEPERVVGHSWEDVSPKDFSCSPQMELSNKMVQGEVGGNATFSCFVHGDPEPEVRWFFNGRLLGNGTPFQDQVLLIEEEEGYLEKWTNLTILNLTEQFAGDYTCFAKNTGGVVSRNVTLLLPEVVIATTLSKAESWLLWAGIVAGGVVTFFVLIVAVLCCCICGRRRKKRKRKSKMKNSVSYTEQEKKLLDVSITERPSGAGSFEGMSQTEMELLDVGRDQTSDHCEQMHVTIERHNEEPNVPSSSSAVVSSVPVAAAAAASAGTYTTNTSVFPPRGTLAPPPEFSSTLPTGTFGNIFISVSVTQEPEVPPPDGQRYPDLLDIPHRTKASSTVAAAAISVATGPDLPSSHTPYFHQDLHCPAPSFQQSYNNPYPAITEQSSEEDPISRVSYATLPRRQKHKENLDSRIDPVVRVGPQYDNMGPRITADGSSKLSLHGKDLENLTEDEGSDPHLTDIPPPPPPPLCSPLPPEYVSL